jgi:hypothetical protein
VPIARPIAKTPRSYSMASLPSTPRRYFVTKANGINPVRVEPEVGTHPVRLLSERCTRAVHHKNPPKRPRRSSTLHQIAVGISGTHAGEDVKSSLPTGYGNDRVCAASAPIALT